MQVFICYYCEIPLYLGNRCSSVSVFKSTWPATLHDNLKWSYIVNFVNSVLTTYFPNKKWHYECNILMELTLQLYKVQLPSAIIWNHPKWKYQGIISWKYCLFSQPLMICVTYSNRLQRSNFKIFMLHSKPSTGRLQSMENQMYPKSKRRVYPWL